MQSTRPRCEYSRSCLPCRPKDPDDTGPFLFLSCVVVENRLDGSFDPLQVGGGLDVDSCASVGKDEAFHTVDSSEEARSLSHASQKIACDLPATLVDDNHDTISRKFDLIHA